MVSLLGFATRVEMPEYNGDLYQRNFMGCSSSKIYLLLSLKLSCPFIFFNERVIGICGKMELVKPICSTPFTISVLPKVISQKRIYSVCNTGCRVSELKGI
jgi:hypothetical protein